MLTDRPETSEELDEVLLEFRYELRQEMAYDRFDAVINKTAYGDFEDRLTHDEMDDIFRELGGD